MSIDEGYVKYTSDWTPGPALRPEAIATLCRWRRVLYQAGLIGHYAKLGIGFGNISMRSEEPEGLFIISGTQTGHLADTGPEHYALVTGYDIAANRLSSTGPVHASSEALTHAAIYELDPGINAVVHVHSSELWHRHIDQLPTTAPEVTYGTPAMATEFMRLHRDTLFDDVGIAVMAGHPEGLIAIGATLAEAARRILQLAASKG